VKWQAAFLAWKRHRTRLTRRADYSLTQEIADNCKVPMTIGREVQLSGCVFFDWRSLRVELHALFS